MMREKNVFLLFCCVFLMVHRVCTLCVCVLVHAHECLLYVLVSVHAGAHIHVCVCVCKGWGSISSQHLCFSSASVFSDRVFYQLAGQ